MQGLYISGQWCVLRADPFSFISCVPLLRPSGPPIISVLDHLSYDPVDHLSYDPVDHLSYDPVGHLSYDPVDHLSYDPVGHLSYDPVDHLSYDGWDPPVLRGKNIWPPPLLPVVNYPDGRWAPLKTG